MKEKFKSLETYRAFAALMIAAIHFDVNSPLVNHSLANGYFVQFFFTLSGFVIYFNYNDKITNLENLLKFTKKRFLRLYPLHLFFLILFLVIELAKYYIEYSLNIEANNRAFSKNNINAIIANLFLIQTFLKEYTFNTPSWSISAEFYTYILFAFLALYYLRTFTIFIVIILILFFRLNDTLVFGAPNSEYKSFLDCIYSFFWGIIFCKLYISLNQKIFYRKINNLMSMIFIFLTFFSITRFSNNFLFLLPIIFGLLIFFSCDIDRKSFLGFFVCNKIGVYLGKISYSIYLSHLFVFWFSSQLLRFIFKFDTFIEEETGVIRLDFTIVEASLMVVASYLITIIFSHYLYKFVEIKFYKRL